MKNLVFRSVLVSLCAIAIVGCKKKDEPTTSCMPCPPYLSVHGTITNEEGLSLDSIQVTLQKEDAWWWSNCIEYTNEIGTYEYFNATSSSGFLYGIIEEFPAEVTVIATDTTGVYETQKQTCTVVERIRYPENPDWRHMYIDGIATANFVMKRK